MPPNRTRPPKRVNPRNRRLDLEGRVARRDYLLADRRVAKEPHVTCQLNSGIPRVVLLDLNLDHELVSWLLCSASQEQHVGFNVPEADPGTGGRPAIWRSIRGCRAAGCSVAEHTRVPPAHIQPRAELSPQPGHERSSRRPLRTECDRAKRCAVGVVRRQLRPDERLLPPGRLADCVSPPRAATFPASTAGSAPVSGNRGSSPPTSRLAP